MIYSVATSHNSTTNKDEFVLADIPLPVIRAIVTAALCKKDFAERQAFLAPFPQVPVSEPVAENFDNTLASEMDVYNASAGTDTLIHMLKVVKAVAPFAAVAVPKYKCTGSCATTAGCNCGFQQTDEAPPTEEECNCDFCQTDTSYPWPRFRWPAPSIPLATRVC